MIPKPLHSFIAWILGAVAAGAIAHAIFRPTTPEARRAETFGIDRNESSVANNFRESSSRASDRHLKPSATNRSPGSVVLQLDVVDALLSGGGQQKMFQRMRLTEDDVRRVAEIRAERVGELERLEAGHAKLVSDANGEYIAIDAFPEDRRLWLAAMESDLRTQLGDDRATIIARMISFSDNDEDVGVYRRELHILRPDVEGGKFRIEEKSFSEQGRHIDSDYEYVDDNSKNRWGHLLNFGTKN